MAHVEPDIGFEDFLSLDMRVGTVVEAEAFAEARKPAIKVLIDFGELGTRASSAQVTDLYTPQSLIGRQVIAAINLGSKRIAGFKSECLVLGVPDGEGHVSLLRPDSRVANGVRVY